MSFYDLTKEQRSGLVNLIEKQIIEDLSKKSTINLLSYFNDEDTYIRKSAYTNIGKIYFRELSLQSSIITLLNQLYIYSEYKVRQTAVNAAGEIGKKEFKIVENIFSEALFDPHHSVRNAVIGSIKKMGEKNPKPILKWAEKFLHHDDKEIRREICHGIELRGRKHPEDILPLLKELQFDSTKRVRSTLVHVLGQISYKKNCLEIVLKDLKEWQNKELVHDALNEIIDVHNRYKNFSYYSQEQANEIIKMEYGL